MNGFGPIVFKKQELSSVAYLLFVISKDFISLLILYN
jgi:hypothetical protein